MNKNKPSVVKARGRANEKVFSIKSLFEYIVARLEYQVNQIILFVAFATECYSLMWYSNVVMYPEQCEMEAGA